MRIDVSEAALCGCDTCVQHRTLSNTQETEPSNVIGSSITPVPVSPEPVQPLGSTSDQSSGTETTSPLAPPVTTSVNPEQPAQSADSTTIFKFPPVSSEPAQALAPTATASGSTQAPAFGFGAFAARAPSFATSGFSPISFAPPVTSSPVQALGTTTTTTSATAAASSTSSPVHSSSPITFQFAPAFTSAAASGPVQAPTFASGSSSTSSPFDVPSQLRWGSSLQANGPTNTSPPPFSFLPAQGYDKTGSAFTPPFGYHPDGFARPDVGVSPTAPGGYFSSPLGRAPKNPFGSFLHPGFGPSNLFGPNAQTTIPVTGCSPFWASFGTEQGSRYPPYAPTPDFDNSGGPVKQIISISASNSRGHKSHEELRWEDYKNGDKGGFGWFPPAAHASPFSAPTVSPSFFVPPSRPERPQMRTIDLTHRDMSGFPIGYNTPTPFQRPHEPFGVSSSASGCCTACGATSSSSPSVHLGFNVATNPPSAAASLPGMFLSTYGSCPLVFATPNLAAYGTTTATPAVQAYAIMFGTPNFTSQGTTAAPAVQAYPVMFVTPNLAGQGTTTTPAAQAYPTMFGTPNLAAQGSTTTAPSFQGTTTDPGVQAYPTMFGTPNLAGQGTTTTAPAAQRYPTMFGTPNLAGQGTTTTTPAGQPYPTMFGVTQATTTPAVQPNAMMFGTPSVGAQGITPGGQAYLAHGLTPLLPFGAMSLQ